MRKKQGRENPVEIAEIAIQGVQEKKGLKIRCLDLRDIPHAVSDFFIVCHGNSNVHVEAIASSVEIELREKLSERPWHKEGSENASWILLDYVNVVVHVFQEEAREFYGLEELWADAKVKEVTGEEAVELLS